MIPIQFKVLHQHIVNKDETKSFAWRAIAASLAPVYHSTLQLKDVLYHVTVAYSFMLSEPRFEVAQRSSAQLNTLLLAPIEGFASVEMFGPSDGLKTHYSVEEVYNAFIAHMMGQISIARIDWCREQLYDLNEVVA